MTITTRKRSWIFAVYVLLAACIVLQVLAFSTLSGQDPRSFKTIQEDTGSSNQQCLTSSNDDINHVSRLYSGLEAAGLVYASVALVVVVALLIGVLWLMTVAEDVTENVSEGNIGDAVESLKDAVDTVKEHAHTLKPWKNTYTKGQARFRFVTLAVFLVFNIGIAITGTIAYAEFADLGHDSSFIACDDKYTEFNNTAILAFVVSWVVCLFYIWQMVHMYQIYRPLRQQSPRVIPLPTEPPAQERTYLLARPAFLNQVPFQGTPPLRRYAPDTEPSAPPMPVPPPRFTQYKDGRISEVPQDSFL